MKWTKQHDEIVRSWSDAGMSAAQIADKIGRSRNAVCGRKFRLGIFTPEKAGRRFSDEELAKITSMRLSGNTIAKIADELGRTEASITVKISKVGIVRRSTKRQLRDALVKALTEILEANQSFRAGMPSDWEGDPLQDACERGASVLAAVGQTRGQS